MNPGTRIIHLFTLLVLFTGTCARAQDSTEQDELNQFMQLLEQQTTLATQTRLNADFVPGMLSVLEADQMQRRGFRTVWEALASLPGVRPTLRPQQREDVHTRRADRLVRQVGAIDRCIRNGVVALPGPESACGLCDLALGTAVTRPTTTSDVRRSRRI